MNSLGKNIIKKLKGEFEDYYKKQKIIIKICTENYNCYKGKYQMNFINLIENIKKNKIENSKRINNVNMNDIRDNTDSKKNSHRKFFNTSNYKNKMNSIEITNVFPAKSKNSYEEIKINQFKSPIERLRKHINSDINSVNIVFSPIKKFKSRNVHLNANTINKFNESRTRPYSTLRKTTNNKDLNNSKKTYNFFYNDTNTKFTYLKYMKRDNHFSRQNFRLKKIKSEKRLPLRAESVRNKSINNTSKEKKYFEPILINNLNNNNNDDDFHRKIGNEIKNLKNKFCGSEKRMKYINKKIETHRNYESTIEIPLMIIRNVSLHSPK